MKSKQSAQRLSGKTVTDVKNSGDKAINELWNAINKLNDATRPSKSDGVVDTNKQTQIRLVQEGDNYFLEAKFPNGWARIPNTMTLIGKGE